MLYLTCHTKLNNEQVLRESSLFSRRVLSFLHISKYGIGKNANPTYWSV